MRVAQLSTESFRFLSEAPNTVMDKVQALKIGPYGFQEMEQGHGITPARKQQSQRPGDRETFPVPSEVILEQSGPPAQAP